MKLRTYIIEYATMLDEVCSLTLCELLQIKKDKSISFGYKTMALSFNHKINLLVDLSTVDKTIQNKFQIFAEIRNKFAHVFEVNSYTTFVNLNDDTKQKCKKLEDWFPINTEQNELQNERDLVSSDFIFLTRYILLYRELSEFAISISLKNVEKRGYEEGRKAALETSYQIMQEEIMKLHNKDEILKKINDKVKQL